MRRCIARVYIPDTSQCYQMGIHETPFLSFEIFKKKDKR